MSYRGTVESILSSCIIAWFGNCNASDRKTLQRIVRTAEKTTGVSFPSVTDNYTTRCTCKAISIVKDPTHPSHGLSSLMPSGRSSAFNTIIPHKLVSKLGSLGLDSSICSWGLCFLTDRPQCVRIGNHTSSTLILNTGTPQGCVLSPILFTLFTNDCTPTHSSNTIIKFADDTTIVGLISDGDERAYRNEVECLDGWCKVNDLVLNTSKTKEIVVDFRRTKKSDHLPLHISGAEVERVEKVKFLGVHITNHLTWSSNTSCLCMRAQQRLYFLRKLKQAQLPQKLLVNFYRSTIESILSHCMIVWYSSCTVSERKDLHRVVKVAGRIIGTDLPSLDSVHTSRLKKKASSVSRDATHPGHCLFDLLPSGKRVEGPVERVEYGLLCLELSAEREAEVSQDVVDELESCSVERGRGAIITGSVGDTVELPCSCKNPDPVDPQTVQWGYRKHYKDSEYIADHSVFPKDGSVNQRYKDRVKITTQNPPGQVSLIISPLTEEDEGRYVCGNRDYIRVIILYVGEPFNYESGMF
ncbi:hypothetical protein NFI96_000505 [Prochilodus magdalenae]|nr:hypothetical protein NFI96_000505 [Prochilodus magdalenae]